MDDVIRVPLGDLTDLADGEMRACKAGSFAVLVCRVGGALHAVEDECSHAETTLSDGMLDGYVVTCPLHFAQFDVRDGSHLCPPAFKGVASFPVTDTGEGYVEMTYEAVATPPEPGSDADLLARGWAVVTPLVALTEATGLDLPLRGGSWAPDLCP